MEHVRQTGFPAPAVKELRAADTELVMERINGPLMGEAVERQPWRLSEMGRLLAALHLQLGQIKAPKGLRQIPTGGESVVHLDLHPFNVIMTKGGPIVIDWSSAARGRPEIDVAATWVIMRSSEIPGSLLEVSLSRLGRRAFIGAFLRHSDRSSAAKVLPTVINARIDDPNVTDRERRFLARWAASLAAPI
jgi:Ser/Thr protein kinase RdoA (MazF antagonist)